MTKYFLEIKNRIFLLLLTVLSTLVISYLYKETLLFLITQPERLAYKNNSSAFYFIFTNVTEILSAYIQLMTFFCFQAFLFFNIYHCFAFFSPAMFKSEYYFLFNFLKCSMLIWFCSTLVSHFLLAPITWDFFLSFQNLFSLKFLNLYFEAKLIEYLEFYLYIYYVCVVYFQVFTILFFILCCISNRIEIIRKFRKIYYYFFLVFSTLISPPDFISQFVISLILICIYEVLVFTIIIKTILVR